MIEVNQGILPLILLNIGKAHHFGDWNFIDVKSPFARIYFVLKGEGQVEIDSKEYCLKPGFLYLIPPFKLHTDSCDDEFVLYYLHIYENQLQQFSIFEKLLFPFEVRASLLDRLLFEQIYNINPDRHLIGFDPKKYDTSAQLFRDIGVSKKQPLHQIIETNGIIHQLFSRFITEAVIRYSTSDKRIIDALNYISGHLNNPLSATILAKFVCLSVDHFIRLFKRELNCTPQTYINQRRMEKAQLLLAVTKMPVQEIAFSLAFSHVTYFNRLFKQLVGDSPLSYRRNNTTT